MTGPERDRPLSLRERRAQGKATRRTVPRDALAAVAAARRDPIGILAAQDATRVPELVPLRAERMAASPFAFYRGSAAIMAADLAAAPHSGILVASCGDAHVANFGLYASPQRSLVFDLNDFDEAAWAPWEWDLKRLTTSIVIGGRASARDEALIERAVRAAIAAYARAVGAAVRRSPAERYFAHFDADRTARSLDAASRASLKAAIQQARRRTGERAARRITDSDEHGQRRFVHDPPTLGPIEPHVAERLNALIADYLATASPDIRHLLTHYRLADAARRVVGVGSVGTRCYLALFEDGDGHTLLLQPKEALPSVLDTYGRIPQPAPLRELIDRDGEGARVVAMQRILQALSDPFLGHLRGVRGDYYVRQFHDMKGGFDVEALEDGPFVTYATACAVTLARAHSQSVTAGEVAGYIGRSPAVENAITEFSYAYAAVALADHQAFLASRAG